LWAPSYGGGYPFGNPGAEPGTLDFAALDTDGDGELSQSDDMYEPYYPGDDVVDWVGLTLYHWGVQWPWIENELPEANSFALLLTGNYHGGNGDQTSVPDFYARYCADGVRNKPLAIPETAAFFNPHLGGAHELAIKQAWWRQVFNITGDTPDALDVALHFPKLNASPGLSTTTEAEQTTGSTGASRLRAGAFCLLPASRAAPRPALHLTAQEPMACNDLTASRTQPAHDPATRWRCLASLLTKAHTNCDLVVELLDGNLQRQAGARTPVAAGTQTVTLTFANAPRDGTTYRWNIFLTPTGGDQSQALASRRFATCGRAIIPAIQMVAVPAVLSSRPISR
jgi:hypothetical protein